MLRGCTEVPATDAVGRRPCRPGSRTQTSVASLRLPTNQPTRSKPRRYERRDLCAVNAVRLCFVERRCSLCVAWHQKQRLCQENAAGPLCTVTTIAALAWVNYQAAAAV